MQWASGTLTVIEREGRELKSQFHIGPKLRTSGYMPLIPLYAFVMWTGTTLYLKA